MPVVFQDNWNHVKLAALNSHETIFLFWLAKKRIAQRAPVRRAELAGLLVAAEARTLTPSDKLQINALPGAVKNKPVDNLKKELEVLDNGIKRAKVSLPMLTRFGEVQHASFNQEKVKLDRFMETIHNDRLRLSDREMLGQYSRSLLAFALYKAKTRFTNDLRVAALLADVVGTDMAKAVTVTQGVHQADDPHFDVKKHNEDQQYHINVTLKPDFGIKSISFMNGATKSEGITTVLPDLPAAAPAHREVAAQNK